MGFFTVSKEAPDGTQRRHAWDPALAQERKSVIKTQLLSLLLALIA